MTLIPLLLKNVTVSNKKMTKLENIKSVQDHLQKMFMMFQDDAGIATEVEICQKLFNNLVKTFETVKKTRSNSNTGLGKKRFVTSECSAFIRVADHAEEKEDDMASRSYMTSLISTYVKMNALQSVEEPLFFRIDRQLETLFNIKKYIGDNMAKLEKVMELRCITQRLTTSKEEAVELYKSCYAKLDASDTEQDAYEQDILNIICIKENDLISWRECLKILFIVFKDGTH